jgi:hypothetical protein
VVSIIREVISTIVSRATAFVAFFLLGFLEIGQEMYVLVFLNILADVDDNRSENPFNYDLNDLDLDSFCLMLQRDLHEITAASVLTGCKLIFLVVTSSCSILAHSSLTIMSLPPGISHSLPPIGDLRKRL